MRKKILSIIGARPQFIKHSPVQDMIRHSFNEKVVHTGQHYDDNMSEIFFREMKIRIPEYNLMAGSGNHAVQTGTMMKGLEEIMQKEKPDCVLVYGDTNSTIAGSLTAAKLNIPVAHIEAGLRSFNMKMPEEINRIVTDRLSFLNFAPTRKAVHNLKREGLTGILTGDVMYDAFEKYSGIISQRPVNKSLPEKFALLTIHRASNTETAKLGKILSRLNKAGIRMIFPVHPRTAKLLKTMKRQFNNITTIEPLGYLDMLAVLKACSVVITDSGGLQKEAYWASKQCITLREETEWTETMLYNRNVLCPDALCDIRSLIRNVNIKNPGAQYGNGNASAVISEVIKETI